MQAYLVGGAVRDRLLGRPVTERDWVVVGSTPEAMLEAGFRPVGRDFPVFLHPETHEEYALARTERKSGRGYHGFTFHAAPDVSLEEDLRRRDLTINAIAERADGSLVDPWGGLADLEARVLRHVSPAFVEDPLRVLRVARFAARYAPLGFSIAPETMDLMRAIVAAGEMEHLVAERVWAECARGLTEARPSVFIATLRETGALAVWLPEVDRLYGVPQRPEYHPEVDTGIHQQMVSDQIARLAPGDTRAAWAALTHDLGKGITPAHVLPAHIGHEAAGLPLVDAASARLKVPADHAQAARDACCWHLDCHRAFELRAETVVGLLDGIDAWRQPWRLATLLVVCEADKRGRLGREDVPYPQAEYLREAHAAAAQVRAETFVEQGLTGPAIGQAMRHARIAAVARVREVHRKS